MRRGCVKKISGRHGRGGQGRRSAHIDEFATAGRMWKRDAAERSQSPLPTRIHYRFIDEPIYGLGCGALPDGRGRIGAADQG